MTLLLLAGTREARELSLALSDVPLISSLAGVTQRPAALAGTLRVGGFGGVSGLVAFLRSHAIRAVVDATHPFADQMSRHAFEACRRAQTPLLQVVRPPWAIDASWQSASDLDAAAGMLPPGAHVFLATGRMSLSAFAARSDVSFTVRVIDKKPDPFPLAQGRFLVSHPPFTVPQEIATLGNMKVDVLVSRNSGGTGGAEKLEAAKQLGIPVIMVERPDLPRAPRVETVAAARDHIKGAGWLDG